MKKPQRQQYNKGKFPNLWRFLVHLHKETPDAFSDDIKLKYHVSRVWPEILNNENCANCGESMMEYTHRLDFFNALLLKEMGDIVKKKMAGGMGLTEANAVHVVSQDIHDCVRHRTTQCKTLGLIAKVKTDHDTHDREKGWLITSRGFAALRGDRVPSEVVVFRNRIEERPDSTVTLDEVFEAYRGDNSNLVGDRNPMEWVNFHGNHRGEIL